MKRKQEQNKALFRCLIKNKTETSADLYFYGDIVSDKGCKWSADDKCPMDVVEALEDCKDIENLNIYINSGGGDVFAGNAIYNRLKAHKAHKTVHIDGVAASIASVIALAGDEIIMPGNSYMMIHKAWTIAVGNSDDLRNSADRLEQIEQSIVDVYNACTGDDVDENKIKELMAAETWLSASEAADFFTAITVSDSVKAAACMTDMEYMNAPKSILMKSAKPDDSHEEKPDEDDNPDKTQEKEVANTLNLIENFLFTEGECENE